MNNHVLIALQNSVDAFQLYALFMTIIFLPDFVCDKLSNDGCYSTPGLLTHIINKIIGEVRLNHKKIN